MELKLKNDLAIKLLVGIGSGVVILLLVIGIALVGALPVMIAWNYSIPAIFSLPEISFVQALCLNILAGSFFKNFTAGKS